ADLAQRQRAGGAEGEQYQRLVPGEGQLVGLERAVQPADEDLLRPHDRGDRGHGGRGAPAPLPVLVCPLDRIERQVQRISHAATLDRKSTRLNSSHVKISY